MSGWQSSGLVFLGAGIGAVARYWIQHFANARFPEFPAGTLLINVAGSFLIGLLVTEKEPFRLLVTVGILGGFTTFSAFSLETMKLIQDGKPLVAAAYVGASVLFSVLGCALGLSFSSRG
jgi:fluoride exporter